MSESSSSTIEAIGRSSAIVFAGVVLELLISLLAKVFIANALPRTGYGEVAIALILLTATSLVARLGLDTGIARNAPRTEGADRRGVLVSAYVVGAVSAGTLTAFLYFGRHVIAAVLGNPALSPVLRIAALGIPALVLMRLSLGAVRSANRSGPKVIVQNLTHPISRIVLLVILVGVGAQPTLVMVAYVASNWLAGLTAFGFAVYHTSLLDRSIGWTPQYRPLLAFSAPLMASGGLLFLLGNTDTVMVQYFFSANEVAVYDIAYLVGNTITFLYGSVGYLFLPKMSTMESEGRWDDIEHIYKLVTKWILFGTLPLYILFAFFPDVILVSVFGETYADGAILLSVVATAYLIRAGFGPNKGLLSATGDTRYIMVTSGVTLVLNVVLNIVLLLTVGVIGAAIASFFTFLALNVGYNLRLHRTYDVHPFSRSMLRPALVFMGIVVVLVAAFRTYVPLTFPAIAGFAVLLAAIYVVSIIGLGGIQSDDIELLHTVEEELGVNLEPIKRPLRRLL